MTTPFHLSFKIKGIIPFKNMSLSSVSQRDLIVSAISVGSTLLLARWLFSHNTDAANRAKEATSGGDISSAGTLPEMPLLPISSKETIEMCCNLELRDSDIFICSYPKSGTTWMQQYVLMKSIISCFSLDFKMYMVVKKSYNILRL
jgi:hypothetical protein